MPFTIQGGRSKKLFEQPNYTGGNVEDLFLEIGQETIDALVQSLKDVDRFVSGNLAQSIDVVYKVESKELSFTISADEYWKFVDKGVNGTGRNNRSPFSFKKKNINQRAMLEFIANRGIYDFKDKSGKIIYSVNKKSKTPKDKRFKTLAFLMGRTLAKRGFKPTNFVGNVINDAWKKDFTKRLTKAIGKDIRVSFNDGNNNK